jgi:threonylcarbamoyladenosine tRNA methylthiotransferase MtaB
LAAKQDKNSRPVKVALATLGCKLNQAESESIALKLAAAGFTLVQKAAQADIFLLNTCTVTHVADRKARHLLQMSRRLNPAVKMVVCGCYAERSAAELSTIAGVEMVIGNRAKDELVGQLQTLSGGNPAAAGPAATESGRVRSFIKAQDGCSSFCAYCIVPLVRGPEKSLPPEEIIQAVKERVSKGYQEVVLTGTEIGRYRCQGIDLKSLLARILRETAIQRLRLSSVQPQEITPELLDLWQDRRLCPHFHIALQSGSNTVLKRMRRLYTTEDYAEAVQHIRASVPDAAITTDVIVGFPGETDTEFADSLAFCRAMRFARMHVFTYSTRPGTAAAAMPDQVKEAVKKRHREIMLAEAGSSQDAFHALNAGRTLEVLCEGFKRKRWEGYTPNYVRVYIESKENLANRIVPVKLTVPVDDGMQGELV